MSTTWRGWPSWMTVIWSVVPAFGAIQCEVSVDAERGDVDDVAGFDPGFSGR